MLLYLEYGGEPSREHFQNFQYSRISPYNIFSVFIRFVPHVSRPSLSPGSDEEEPALPQNDTHDSPAPDEPPNAAAPEPPGVPWDTLFPKKNVFRNTLVQHALPKLVTLLRDPARRLVAPRELVNEALDHCKNSNNTFWGQYGVYTRKRSACDAILCHYLPTLQDYVAGR